MFIVMRVFIRAFNPQFDQSLDNNSLVSQAVEISVILSSCILFYFWPSWVYVKHQHPMAVVWQQGGLDVTISFKKSCFKNMVTPWLTLISSWIPLGAVVIKWGQVFAPRQIRIISSKCFVKTSWLLLYGALPQGVFATALSVVGWPQG